MTTAAHLRRSALTLPEAAADDAAFRVAGKRFAELGPPGEASLFLSPADTDACLAAHPTGRRRTGGVRIALGDLDGQQLNHWLRRAWLAHAPERLTALATAADSAKPGAVGDLPRAIGRPATQALVAAGITTLAQVAGMSDADLLALHGVGQKAVRVLRDTIGQPPGAV